MNREKMLQNPLPIDRVAARVVRPAKPEQTWTPGFKISPGYQFSREVLPTRQLPPAALATGIQRVIGFSRGQMTCIGYAAHQPLGKKNARWVVRCNCGNYEHRSRILAWASKVAPDSCIECRTRQGKLGKLMPLPEAASHEPLRIGQYEYGRAFGRADEPVLPNVKMRAPESR